MSIGSIGSSAVSPLFALRVRSLGSDNSATSAVSSTGCGTGGMCGTAPAQLPAADSFGELGDLSGLAGFNGQSVQESHLALQIRSRTDIRTGSDGSVSERSSTKLRFHYDLTTADGQHIELNVKAKVRQASFEDGAGNSISKTQVKLQFSLLQEGVADDLSPLFSDQVPSETQSGAADGIQAFLSSVGEVLQTFAQSDNVSADDLVAKTVDSFNTLLDALRQLLFPTAETNVPPALPSSGEAPGQIPAIPPPPASDSETAAPVVIPPLPGPITSLPPVPAEVSVTPETPAAEVPPAADQIIPTPEPEPAAGSVPPSTEPVAAQSPTQLATQVLQTARLRFVQSLTQIIRTMAPDQPGSPSFTSQRLDYYSAFSLKIHTTSLVDVNA